jgi:hypothetical protein
MSRFSGFASYDGMFSLIPILFLTVFVLNTMHFLLYDSVEKMDSQEKFNLIVVIADYTVKEGGAYKDGEKVYPNWIDESELRNMRNELSEMRRYLGLPELDFGLEGAEGYGGEEGKTCIYRIVVYGPDKKLDRLFVCG